MSDLNAKVLRPGYIVALSTSIRGNRKYVTTTLEGVHLDENGEQRSRWETERIVEDPKEYAAASVARSKARGQIVNVCSATAFGLLCPEDKYDDLLKGIAEAERVAKDFNDAETTERTRVEVHVMMGKVVQDDVQAVAAITAEVRMLMEDVETGLNKLDAVSVRKACDKLRDTSTMLSDEAKERVQDAIDAARSAARKIVKAGEEAKVEIDKATIDKIVGARVSFLDVEDEQEVKAPQAQAERALDFEPEPQPSVELPEDVIAPKPQATPVLDLGAD